MSAKNAENQKILGGVKVLRNISRPKSRTKCYVSFTKRTPPCTPFLVTLYIWQNCMFYILAFYAYNWLKMRNSCRFLSASIEFWAREKKAASVFVSRSASMVKKE